MTINARIKHLRKIRGWNQADLAALLGITQPGISYLEKDGNSVSESNIKAICAICNVNEDWLRDGKEPIFSSPSSTRFTEFLEDREMSQLEHDILHAYFEIDPKTRKALLEHFVTRLFGDGSLNNK